MAQANIRTRVETRSAGDRTPGSRTRVLLGEAQMDVTGKLVAALAHSLWEARGGDDMTNWADAEAALDQLFGAMPSTPAAGFTPPMQSEMKPSTPVRPVASPAATPAATPSASPVSAGLGARKGTPRR